jgi:biotin transporter BioY
MQKVCFGRLMKFIMSHVCSDEMQGKLSSMYWRVLVLVLVLSTLIGAYVWVVVGWVVLYCERRRGVLNVAGASL